MDLNIIFDRLSRHTSFIPICAATAGMENFYAKEGNRDQEKPNRSFGIIR